MLRAFPDEFVSEELMDPTQTVFEYYVMSTLEKKFHVTKLVPHPRYSMLQHLHCTNSTTGFNKSSSNDENDTVNCDITRINYDVALIKIKRGDKNEGDSPTACINEHGISVGLSNEGFSTKENVFKPTSEELAFELGFKAKTTCYAVGYSFDKLK